MGRETKSQTSQPAPTQALPWRVTFHGVHHSLGTSTGKAGLMQEQALLRKMTHTQQFAKKRFILWSSNIKTKENPHCNYPEYSLNTALLENIFPTQRHVPQHRLHNIIFSTDHTVSTYIPYASLLRDSTAVTITNSWRWLFGSNHVQTSHTLIILIGAMSASPPSLPTHPPKVCKLSPPLSPSK